LPRRPRLTPRTRGVEKGVSFTGYWNDSYVGKAPRASLRALRATGANWAMVLVTVYQDDIERRHQPHRAQTRRPTPRCAAIGYAHHIGLKVMLKPQLDLLNDPSQWRGQIGLDFTDAEWTAWFASYDAQIVHYATSRPPRIASSSVWAANSTRPSATKPPGGRS